MATLRSDFCITRGEGLFAHTKYCDLYIHCTAQAVAITMECSRKLYSVFIYVAKEFIIIKVYLFLNSWFNIQ